MKKPINVGLSQAITPLYLYVKKQISLIPTETTELQKQFFHSLTLGTGRAMLLLKTYPQLDFSKELIAASAKNLANDAPCEGSRANYLYPLIRRAKNRVLIEKTILQKLKNKKSGVCNLAQLCDLALHFHQDGNLHARDIFLERFDKSFQDDYELCGEEQILKMDGLQGLFRLADKIGRLSEDEWAWYEYRWDIDDFQKANPSIDVFAEFENAAKNNPYIHNYFKLISSIEPLKRARRKVPSAYTVSDVEEIINRPNKRAGFGFERTRRMSQQEIVTVARNFLDEKDKLRKFKYLRFFYATKFPFDYAPLLKIASGQKNHQTRAVNNAVLALSHFSGDDIRALALKKLREERIPCEYLHLLVSNYQAGDAEMLVEIIGRAKNFDEVHLLVQGIIAIYKANPGADCKAPLEAMYYSMNCALHRRDLLEILNGNAVLSDDILEELAYDTDADIRKLSRSIKRSRKSEAISK
ncbi:hypothetical protein ACO0LF_06025 [Undibacterium sp. Di27W]|uniref:hypothetical protein n=1 Tax=Undibacterium sp. Di27W TaxID=3413036 RepID=UPI003BF4339B